MGSVNNAYEMTLKNMRTRMFNKRLRENGRLKKIIGLKRAVNAD